MQPHPVQAHLATEPNPPMSHPVGTPGHVEHALAVAVLPAASLRPIARGVWAVESAGPEVVTQCFADDG
jgi:hypothetical protein